MGEVVLSSEDLEMNEAAEKNRTETEMNTCSNNNNMNSNNNGSWKMKDGCSSSGAITRCDRFLPGMMMRVLLVEADDSTRQIIAALLRKCSYRVAAVPDGLKAWELLKGRPHDVDLILTEVDLPSISGFALLTLITEHEVCKNIPVIMMSSQDSISTVYKCMMRGAADYLIKPIRRNELSNLWQHVWRRKASTANGPQDESVAQQKVEATSENDAASNHSNGNTACIQRNEDNIDKGSDAQSSCTKPEMEVESVHMEKMQEFSQPPVLAPFQLAGPMALWIQDARDMRISLLLQAAASFACRLGWAVKVIDPTSILQDTSVGSLAPATLEWLFLCDYDIVVAEKQA